ncbi:hypothetical protein Amal_02867 [Acetobacter malorum]|uniref:STAS domain-containing protein n=1 Tax=Acetobacter malorum TaxID=178901 RepID=A0A177G636_9PROT|nr:hypothetical protein [Acetobacter malorum]OAG75768.1 hypothetical protein Amal_02867 [Acetobacter malorum]
MTWSNSSRILLSHKPKAPPPFRYKLRPVVGEAAGFEQIGDLYQQALFSTSKFIFVDCISISWIDAHLSAGYAAVQHLLKISGITLSFLNLAPRVAEIFEHHGLLGPSPSKTKKTVIPLTRFNPGDSVIFAGYTQDHLNRLPIPEMSAEVSEKFFEGIDELFSNSELHSKTQHGMFACGQFFPRKNKLDFSLVDLGLGFQRVINDIRQMKLDPSEAINWAMMGSNTTRSGDIPGGLGLKILKDFVKLNGGKLTIVSHSGHWQLSANATRKSLLKTPFPGTAVTLEINTSDNNKYYMT